MNASEEYVDKAKAELAELEAAGVVMVGNAFSQMLLVKGEPEDEGMGLLSGKDGVALHAALNRLGYAPEDWAGLSTLDAEGFPLAPGALRLAIVTLDPSTLIALDEPAAAALREAYADELVDLEVLEQAALMPGAIAKVLGMRVMNLGGFAASLADPKAKQLMWARLKQLPPMGEPY